MRILVVGAGDFVREHIIVRLRAAGHSMICAGQTPARLAHTCPGCDTARVDLATDRVQAWIARLRGVDAVINAAGILRGNGHAVQHLGTMRLFDARSPASVLRHFPLVR
jgi:nucleoside-diphosphate-sugar epimerase